MQILISTDHTIEGDEKLNAHIQKIVEHALRHLDEHIARIEVHLSDENGPKTGANDIRCVMEAHLEHHQPLAVTHHATGLHQAVEGAINKLSRLLGSAIDQRNEQKRNPSPLPQAPLIPEA
jgi:ribosome-associated translation inhibitor RaiA